MSPPTRRQYLAGTAAALAVGLAGCDGGDEQTTTAQGLSGSDYPDIEEWLTTEEVGGADDTYDGTLVDARGESSLTIEVGSSGNGGSYAYGPSAVVADTGTTITWQWTGQGEAHNVEALPEEQLGISDYEFSSGEPVAEAGTTHERTLDTAGLCLYHCEPHFALGMKGGIAVE